MAALRLLVFSLFVILVVFASAQSTLPKTQDATIEDSRKVAVNSTAPRTSLIVTDDAVKAKPKFLQKDTAEVSSEEDKSEEELEEAEGEDSGGDSEDDVAEEDEYEDELRAVAESHEAMSHDDTKKSNTSLYDSKSSDEKLITAKNFDSREKSVEDSSDENESSNEADIDDDIEKKKKDKEVEELLEKKKKRLPTVKKELRTQKEIQTDNDTLEEEVLTANVLKMLVKLAENPERWERVHQLLMDVEGGLEFSRRALQARKRNLLPSSYFNSVSTTPKVDDPLRTFKKPKKKKKKKKPHHKSTTTSSLPVTTPLISTTESPWPTTSIPWRFVAENFGSPLWQDPIEDNPKNVAKIRYSKPRSSLSGRQLINEKQRENLKTLNNQREALMLKTAREYSQPRLLHFGKVNTHQVPFQHRDAPSAFDDESMRLRDYDPSELVHYKHSRYPQYLPRDFPMERFQNDFQNDFGLQSGGFARNQEYRPSGREFAASKSWQNIPFEYRKPAKLPKNYPWYLKNRDFKPWAPWRKPLIGGYWSRLENEDDEMDSLEKSWQLHQRHHQQPWKMSPSDSWPGDKSLQVPPWSEKPAQSRHQDQSFAWDRAKNRSELKLNPTKQDSKEKSILPKITMKSWNSLTSDPATWPFKLPDAKPWPKDQNGKSYNPNADLVRKLGLDKQNKLLADKSSAKDFKSLKYKDRTMSLGTKDKNENNEAKEWHGKILGDDDWMSKVRSSENLSSDDDSRSWNLESGEKSWHGGERNVSPKIQSVRGWEMSVDQSTWRPYDLKPMESYDQDSAVRPWSVRSNERMWNSKSESGPWPQKIGEDWNEGFGKQSGNSNNWPSKWKQFAYHRVTAMPITKAGSTLEGSAKPKNAFIAVSAVSSSKYNNNDWRKNDIEETPINQNSFRSVDPDHPVSQLRSSIESPIYAWKKDGHPSNKTRSIEILPSDPLEHQLVDLRLNTTSQDYSKSKNEVNESAFSKLHSLNPSNGSVVGNSTKESNKRPSNLETERILKT